MPTYHPIHPGQTITRPIFIDVEDRGGTVRETASFTLDEAVANGNRDGWQIATASFIPNATGLNVENNFLDGGPATGDTLVTVSAPADAAPGLYTVVALGGRSVYTVNPVLNMDGTVALYGISAYFLFVQVYPLTTRFGCTDPAATNYDPSAAVDDGSCSYTVPTTPPVITVNGTTIASTGATDVTVNGVPLTGPDQGIDGQFNFYGSPGGDYIVVATGPGGTVTVIIHLPGSSIDENAPGNTDDCKCAAWAAPSSMNTPWIALACPGTSWTKQPCQ